MSSLLAWAHSTKRPTEFFRSLLGHLHFITCSCIDFNIWSKQKRMEKLRYMDNNPVRRGLVLEPEQWAWSSYRAYAFGEAGVAKLNQWRVARLF
jgi:hypothetical protein